MLLRCIEIMVNQIMMRGLEVLHHHDVLIVGGLIEKVLDRLLLTLINHHLINGLLQL